MKEQDYPHQNDRFTFQNYLVVFIDILGQRNDLLEIKGLPTHEDELNGFIEKIRKTFGKVDVVRRVFRKSFEELKLRKPNTDLVPIEHQEEFIASQKIEAYSYGFSDSTIIAVPLMGNDENCTAVNGVYSAFLTTSGISLTALSAQITLRGGLEIGVATEIEGKEIYGPALERAYFLESNIAEYPRFVIGKELVNYLLSVENQQCKTRLGLVAKNLAKFCREMIVIDTDGWPILDYLGQKAREAAENSINIEVVKLAMDFASSQYKKYFEEENYKLTSRYFRLLNYVNTRVKIWGLE